MEKMELDVIRENLSLNEVEKKWTTKLPYKEDPNVLENNYKQATKIMEKQEKRLRENPEIVDQYNEAFKDFVDRGVLVELTKQEREQWKGPVFYSSHQEVFKQESESTPVRIATNASLLYRGKSLNSILMKGPNTLGSVEATLLRWREWIIALVADLKKMYQSVAVTELDMNVMRIVWRDCDETKEIKVYGFRALTFGVKPAGPISTAVSYTHLTLPTKA